MNGIARIGALAVICSCCVLLSLSTGTQSTRAGSAVVTDGRFTNIYVFPDPSRETWERHLASMPNPRVDRAFFSRAAIDSMTATLMSLARPSYFDELAQYGVHPPQFFGSGVATQACVNAAMADLNNGVLQWSTIRSLANCHEPGLDPSPQVNLIFSPDIKVGSIVLGTNPSADMCAVSTENAWHGWGLNTPNYAALPTSVACMNSFVALSLAMSHEDVEMLSDPGGFGMANPPNYDRELADKCNPPANPSSVVWQSLTFVTYWSDVAHGCVPTATSPQPVPTPPTSVWMNVSGIPLQRFTGSVHDLSQNVAPPKRDLGQPAFALNLTIATGNDDLRGGPNPGDNCDVTLQLRSGKTIAIPNVNGGQTLPGWTFLSVPVPLPSGGVKGGDIVSVQLHTGFRGGLSGDNWNVQQVVLTADMQPTPSPPPIGSPTPRPKCPSGKKFCPMDDHGPCIPVANSCPGRN